MRKKARSGSFLARLTTAAMASVFLAGSVFVEASDGQEPREGGSSPEQIFPSNDAEQTPENVRGYDSSPHLLDIVWEYKNGWRIVGEPVRVGSRTILVKSRGRLHRLAFERLTESCKERARQFQVTGHIEPLPLPAEQEQALAGWQVRSYRYVRAPGKSVDFLLYAPYGGRPFHGERPLLLFLHGSGGAGRDNFRQWTDAHEVVKNLLSPGFQRHLPCYVMIPQSDDPENCWLQSIPQYPKPALELAVQAIDVLKTGRASRIDLKRLYVTGLSAGAYGCFDALEAFPGKFAAAVPVQGGCPYQFINRYNARPTWMFFDHDEEAVWPPEADGLARRYKTLHVEMRQTQLPGDAFDVWTEVYQKGDFRDWLGRQSLSEVTYPSDIMHPTPVGGSR